MAKKLGGVAGVLGGLTSSREESAPPSISVPSSEAVAEPEAPPAEPEPTERLQTTPEPVLASVQDRAAGQGGKAGDPAPKPPREATVRVGARKGRPPGPRVAEVVDKEKVTLRLSSELMALYRDWSWDERCQLSDLVERALVQFSKRREAK